MWYPPTVTVPATAEPVTLAQAKAQCQIAASDGSRDDQLKLLISTARAKVEKYCGIRLMPQTIRIACDCFEDFSRFPQAPLISVASISYVDAAGAPQTVDDAVYEEMLDDLAPSIALKFGRRWPAVRRGSRITVEAVVGYQAVPPDIVAAMLLDVGKLAAFSRDDLLLRSEQVEGVGSFTYAGGVDVSAAIDEIARNLLENYRNWPL